MLTLPRATISQGELYLQIEMQALHAQNGGPVRQKVSAFLHQAPAQPGILSPPLLLCLDVIWKAGRT